MKRALCGLVYLGEIAVLGCATFMAFLFGAWMESDAFAIGATELDWWFEGGKRLFIVAVAATAFSATVLITNRHVFRWLGLENRRAAFVLATTAFVLVLAAGIVGVLSFVIQKPFI